MAGCNGRIGEGVPRIALRSLRATGALGTREASLSNIRRVLDPRGGYTAPAVEYFRESCARLVVPALLFRGPVGVLLCGGQDRPRRHHAVRLRGGAACGPPPGRGPAPAVR